MNKDELIEELRSIIRGYLETKGLELVGLIYRYEGRDLVLRILLDRPDGGISLYDCAYLNKDISAILDEKDILKDRYILEVASPGLDRPLNTKSDFLRCLNKKAVFFFNEQVNGKMELEGAISKVGDTSVYIDTAGQTLEIPLSKINKAKQIIGNI